MVLIRYRTSFIDILPDHYKQKPVSLYNPRRAPLFNQYRLIVPRTRNFIEVGQFILLLVLFLFVMADRDPSRFGSLELVFMIYTRNQPFSLFPLLDFAVLGTPEECYILSDLIIYRTHGTNPL
jgi:hypothetical protein